MSSVQKTPPPDKRRGQDNTDKALVDPDLVDQREQLYNGGEFGPIERVSLPEAMITSLRGILLDIDPRSYRRDRVSKTARTKPGEFFKQFASGWLKRHPVLNKAEVRDSGRGLHIILHIDPPVEFETEGDRKRWAAMIRVVQRVLPTDPNCPGITALTRPVGSINGKNKAVVRRLKKGGTVTQAEVVALFDKLRAAPFRTVARILFGVERISPCPVCRGEGTTLGALDRNGKCYAKCGTVSLGQLFDAFLKPLGKEG